jgi:UDP-N-acetylmuramyl pentapeptide phosphotransferase/UDP-N-acetylglucosamine-1-phosphate transferase
MTKLAILAFVLTLVCTPVAIWVLQRVGVLDVPGHRSSHTTVVPRGGGTGVWLGAVTALVLAGWSGHQEAWSIRILLVCTSVFAVVGLVDDVRTLGVKSRLAIQVLCATVFVGPWFFVYGPDLFLVGRIVLAAAAVLWVIGYLNAFNFMDGINGISGLHAIVAGAAFVLIARHQQARLLEVCGVAIAAAAAGFLPWNFPKARVFLGDVGSYFIGTWVALGALMAIVWGAPVEAALAPLAVYLADTTVTLLTRMRRGERWGEAHREHVYQQLVDRGWSHAQGALVVAAFSATCAALGLVSMSGVLAARIVADAAIVAVLVTYLALAKLLTVRTPAPVAGRRPGAPAA